jgi:hypothetical protein
MTYTCPVCGEKVKRDLMAFVDHTEAHIVEEIKKKHPEWVEKDGMCARCIEHYRDEMKGGA